MAQKIIALDYETFYSKDFSVVDLGYDRYARDPRCDVYMVSVCDGRECWAGHPRDFNFDSLDGSTLLSHNAAFDQEITLGAVERGLFGFPLQKIAAWHCTANMSAYIWNERSLANAVRVGLGLGVDKGVRDRAKGKTWQDMLREGWSEDMLKYARLDAQHCWTLWDQHNSKWPEWERRLSELTISQGRQGVQIDVPRLEDYIATLERVIFEATNALPWIARGRAPASPIGMAEECRASGIPCPPVKAHDPEAAEDWEETYASRFRWVMGVRNLRKAKKALATMQTIKSRLREDDTVATSTKYFGAHTGRWAGDGGWNLQNQPKIPLFINPDFTFVLDKDVAQGLDKQFEEGTLTDVKALDIRGLITARSGHKLAMPDLSQIEPRCLNYLAGNWELLDTIRGGMAIYEAFARSQGGWTGGELKVEDKKRYAMEKVNVLGLGYGAGWDKAITIGKMYGVDLTSEDTSCALKAAFDGKIYSRGKIGTEWVYPEAPAGAAVKIYYGAFPPLWEGAIFVEKTNARTGVKSLQAQSVWGQQSRAFVAKFRADNPKIVALWRSLDDKLAAAVGEDLVIPLPSGRCMRYNDVQQQKRKFTDDEGHEYERSVLTALIGGRRHMLYGAMICENITQAFARDVFAHNWLLCEASDRFPSLFTAHDENVTEPLESEDCAELLRLMSTTPAWAPGLPVAAEMKVGPRYAK